MSSRRAPPRPASASTPAPTRTAPPSSRDLIGAGMGRLGSADEQAAAIVWLASEAASFVNGAVLPVDDGWSAV